MTNNLQLSRAIFFAALLVTGGLLFLSVSAFKVDWFAPSVAMIVAAAIGWDRFMNDPPGSRAQLSSDVTEAAAPIDVAGGAGVIKAGQIIKSKSASSRRKLLGKAANNPRKYKITTSGKTSG